MDSGGNNGTDRTHHIAPLPIITGGLCVCSDGSRTHITNHSTTDSVCYASFGVRSYHSHTICSGVEYPNEARCQLLRLPLTGNYRRLRRRWCNEHRAWTTE
ncbi:hypothetical protein TNCV_2096381 [Trichonephila clavipes]|nr:hypothetical protein TNCV_2096381 [Trichonephila clavipes]